jgi:transketolase
MNRAKAWLVTGPLGRGAAFAIDFAVALRTMLAQRLHSSRVSRS